MRAESADTADAALAPASPTAPGSLLAAYLPVPDDFDVWAHCKSVREVLADIPAQDVPDAGTIWESPICCQRPP